MVDVSFKDATDRTATASGRIYLTNVAYDLVSRSADDRRDHDPCSSRDDFLQRKEKVQRKGDVLVTAQLAGIMAAKRTSDIIPLCHPIPLSHISVSLSLGQSKQSACSVDQPSVKQSGHLTSGQLTANVEDSSRIDDRQMRYFIDVIATVRCNGRTGVEMEALTAVSASLLTIWDMLKAVAGKDMLITDIHVSHKAGGKSGDFSRSMGDIS